MRNLGKRLVYVAGSIVGVVGLIVVCIADDYDARKRARQCQER